MSGLSNPPRLFLTIALAGAITAISAARVPAQTAPPGPIVVYELSTRWLSPDGVIALAEDQTRDFRIETVVDAGAGRTVRLGGSTTTFDSAGYPIAWEDPPPTRPRISASGLAIADWRGLPGAFGIRFASNRLGGVFRRMPTGLDTGMRWSDDFDWRRERFGVVEAERGTRTTVVERDTVIDGVRHWIVRDSVTLERTEVWPETMYSMEGEASNHRGAAGWRTSRSLWDPERALFVHGVDTMHLEGTVERTLPDGRRSSASHVIVHVESFDVLSEDAFAQLSRRRTEASRSRMRGVVRVATLPIERRLAFGDTTARDSLIALWRNADRERREELEGYLTWSPGERWRYPLIRTALELGDTATAFRHATRIRYPNLDAPTAGFVLDVLADPAIALRWTLTADDGYTEAMSPLFYENVSDTLGNPFCENGAWCDQLAAYAGRADVDPRLADLGLAIRFLRRPAETWQSVVNRAASGGTEIIRRIERFGRGYTFQYTTRSGERPIPEPGRDWTAWRDWISIRGRVLNVDEHTIRIVGRRTGRSFADEFRQAYTAATSDSARIVFGLLRNSTDGASFDVEEIETMVLDGLEPMLTLAKTAASKVVSSAPVAPDSVAVPLLTTLLAIMTGNEDPSALDLRDDRTVGTLDESTALVTDGLPERFIAAIPPGVVTITTAEWAAADPRSAGTSFEIGPVRVTGNLVSIGGSFAGRIAGEPDEAPHHWYSGFQIVLLRTADGWRYVTGSRWIT